MNNWRRNPALVKLDLHVLPLWEWEVMVAWRNGKRVDASKQRVLVTVRADGGGLGLAGSRAQAGSRPLYDAQLLFRGALCGDSHP